VPPDSPQRHSSVALIVGRLRPITRDTGASRRRRRGRLLAGNLERRRLGVMAGGGHPRTEARTAWVTGTGAFTSIHISVEDCRDQVSSAIARQPA